MSIPSSQAGIIYPTNAAPGLATSCSIVSSQFCTITATKTRVFSVSVSDMNGSSEHGTSICENLTTRYMSCKCLQDVTLTTLHRPPRAPSPAYHVIPSKCISPRSKLLQKEYILVRGQGSGCTLLTTSVLEGLNHD